MTEDVEWIVKALRIARQLASVEAISTELAEARAERDEAKAAAIEWLKQAELESRAKTTAIYRALSAEARLSAAEAALEEIADRHIGDCPSALDIDDAAWAARCSSALRTVARNALAAIRAPAEKPGESETEGR
jgi:hypothetical protein